MTPWVILAVSFAVLFVLQLTVCFRAKRRWVRLAPLAVPALLLLAALGLVALAGSKGFSSSWTGAFTLIFALMIGVLCAVTLAGIGLAWLVYKVGFQWKVFDPPGRRPSWESPEPMCDAPTQKVDASQHRDSERGDAGNATDGTEGRGGE